MELKDITTTLAFFAAHSEQARDRAELEELILTLHILRGGTYESNVDWFHARYAQSLLDWRSVGRIVLDELRTLPTTPLAPFAMVWPVEPRSYSPRRTSRRARKARQK